MTKEGARAGERGAVLADAPRPSHATSSRRQDVSYRPPHRTCIRTAKEAARQAAAWGRDKGADGMTNFDAMELAWKRLHRSLSPDALRADPARIEAEILRLEHERGLERRWLPALERLMAMDSPQLLSVRRPRRDERLDTQGGDAVLRLLFRDVTGGRTPQVRSWRLA